MNWYLKVLRQYADFNGRAQRAEYWVFTLVNFFLGFLISVLDVFSESSDNPLIHTLSLLLSLWLIGMIIPGVAVGFRRFHDIDKSGWWIMLFFVPVIGMLILLVYLPKEGTLGQNKYGPNPKKGTHLMFQLKRERAEADFHVGLEGGFNIQSEAVPQDNHEVVGNLDPSPPRDLGFVDSVLIEDAEAQFNLGVKYHYGKGVHKDYKEAAKWFQLAADQGDARAQYNLGLMYYNGFGVPRDYVLAYMWINLANSKVTGEKKKQSGEKLDDTQRRMTSKQISEAQRLSREFKPKGKNE